ncbi:TetR/AcrR family transcriptional regulator [Streptomyces sp. AC495_CC817]|uniref:TetR/AcrR family transcriptional regulator n=1 Tax=Streptomyces sp. AC495_CC817 TaxID=2823900 RepID=UPI001C2664CC|nr:TetR/AcrR family transcriptional regulator [Streptomyces sp. AC495_CC817]
MSDRPTPPGRPRSEDARLAVLNAADDLLVEQGYAALTMKGIAERAKVGRQTVYRWWSSKAEILLEASAADARRELSLDPGASAQEEVVAFLTALSGFLATSDAGRAYRALLGEAQHDERVAELLRGTDVLGESALVVITRLRGRGALPEGSDRMLVAELVGPLVIRILSEGAEPSASELEAMARRFLR